MTPPMVKQPLFVLILTDLDGTLLDNETYEWTEAEPALELCRRSGVPVILVSSKTSAEMDVLRQAMGLTVPFISENGGGIFFPVEGEGRPPSEALLSEGLWKWPLGLSYDRLVKAFREIRETLGMTMRGFSDMTPEEIGHMTGLDRESSLLASRREYDEPFLVQGNGTVNMERLCRAAGGKGLQITSGGRFYHLHGNVDKGEAVAKLISWYRESYSRVFSVALGDSPNDFSMLKRVDCPVLVRSSKHFEGIEEKIQGVRITREMGPRGWNSAVLDILHGKGLGRG